jgi:hypothetical protein
VNEGNYGDYSKSLVPGKERLHPYPIRGKITIALPILSEQAGWNDEGMEPGVAMHPSSPGASKDVVKKINLSCAGQENIGLTTIRFQVCQTLEG